MKGSPRASPLLWQGRRWWWRIVLILLVLAAAFPHATQGLENRGDIVRSVKEIRNCGLLQQSGEQQWRGALWVCDGLEVAKSFIRRVGGVIAGVDPATQGQSRPGGQASQPSGALVETYGFSSRDQELLRRTFYANFYFPAKLSAQGQGQTGSTAGASIGPEGEVLPASTSSNEIQDWNSFLTNDAPITGNPAGKAALLGLASAGRLGQLSSAFEEITYPGGTNPIFEGEIRAGGGTPGGSETQQQLLDAVAMNARKLGDDQRLIHETPFRAVESANYSPPEPSAPPSVPIKPPERERGKEATGTPTLREKASGVGSADTLATGRAGASGLDALGCPTCSAFGGVPGGFGSFFGGSPLSQALRYFGGSGPLGNIQRFLGNGLFGDLLPSRFPSGGGGGESGGRPSTDERPPVDACAQQAPTLSAGTVRDVADFLGLPVAEDRWIMEYRSVASVVGTAGTVPGTGIPLTITNDLFAEQTCLWTVTANPQGQSQHVAFVSDIQDNGTAFLLEL